MLPRTNVPNVHSAETLPGVSAVGRLNAEPSPLPLEVPGGRTIRPLQPLSTFSAETTENVVSVTRPPRAVAPPEPRVVEPIRPTLPPRQVDGELLKQIRESWRERALADHAGQRCGTCRFFQSAEGAERGTCGCTFATNSYRQALSRTDLGCLDSLGGWWAATDDGWRQKPISARASRHRCSTNSWPRWAGLRRFPRLTSGGAAHVNSRLSATGRIAFNFYECADLRLLVGTFRAMVSSVRSAVKLGRAGGWGSDKAAGCQVSVTRCGTPARIKASP